MLSRGAEPLFRIGSAIERADCTASVIDAHLQLLQEEPWTDENRGCRTVFDALEVPMDDTIDVTQQVFLATLAVDRSQPASIASLLGAAREDARRAHDLVSTELWACLNTARARAPRKVADDRAHAFTTWVRERSALAIGIVESSMRRDDAWHWFTLGRSLERARLTARLVAAQPSSGDTAAAWTTVLRSCGAHESYQRTHGGTPDAPGACGFLILDQQCPRSILFSVARAEQSLAELERSRDVPGRHEVRRDLARLRGELECRSIGEILADLPDRMRSVERATRAISALASAA